MFWTTEADGTFSDLRVIANACDSTSCIYTFSLVAPANTKAWFHCTADFAPTQLSPNQATNNATYNGKQDAAVSWTSGGMSGDMPITIGIIPIQIKVRKIVLKIAEIFN